MTGSESFKDTVQYTNLAGERFRRLVQLFSLISSLAQGIPGQSPIPVLLTLQIMRGGSSSFDSFCSAARLCCLIPPVGTRWKSLRLRSSFVPPSARKVFSERIMPLGNLMQPDGPFLEMEQAQECVRFVMFLVPRQHGEWTHG